MYKLSNYINRLANLQVALCSWAVVVLGLVMTVVVVLQVFFRFVVFVPFPWSEELSRYLMIWMGMLGAVIAQRKGLHIGVRLLVERLSGKARAGLTLLVQLAMMGFLAVLLVQGWGLASFNAGQLSPAMRLNMWVPYLSLPLGAAMMMINVLSDILEDHFPTAMGSRANLAAPALGMPGPGD